MAELKLEPGLMISDPRSDYALVDSGDGRKLERYGDFHFIRPEPQAMWTPESAEWQADGEFIPASDDDGGGRWHLNRNVPEDGWPLRWEEVHFTAQCTPFRHLAYFPDMDPVWRWIRGKLETFDTGKGPEISAAQSNASNVGNVGKAAPKQAMNLFGYTGVGTLALSAAGANLVHVDASKKSVSAARDNAALSGMTERPIRWIIDDAAKFAAREVRRERRYDAILLDPPKYGRGPDGEIWRLEEDLAPLVENCGKLLDENSRCLFLTVYAVRMSALALGSLLKEKLAHLGGTVEVGELAVREEARGLLLPTAIYARWSQ